MRTYITIHRIYDGDKWTNGFYFHSRRYLIDEILDLAYNDHVSSYKVRIGQNTAWLHRDEANGKWYVYEKRAAA